MSPYPHSRIFKQCLKSHLWERTNYPFCYVMFSRRLGCSALFGHEKKICQNKWPFIYRHISSALFKGLIEAEIPSVPEVTKVRHPISRMGLMSANVIGCISLYIIVNYNYNPLFPYLSKLPPTIIFFPLTSGIILIIPEGQITCGE